MKPVYIDGVLKNWGDRLYYEKIRGVGQRPPKNVFGRKGAPRPQGSRVSATTVRRKLFLTAKKAPEVMVKITSGSKNARGAQRHIDYISRNGKLPLEDERGNIYNGKEKKEVLVNWQGVGLPIPEDGQERRVRDKKGGFTERKETLNIVLSMPAGTDPDSVRSAAREFAKTEFSRHQYVMALHDGTEDDHQKGGAGRKNEKTKAPHPHVHLSVKAVDLDGRRLTPRKNDIQCWRERFADKLIEHGIEANATPRGYRGQNRNGYWQKDLHQGALTSTQKTGGGSALMKSEAAAFAGYREMAEALKQSESADDRLLGAMVAKYAQERDQRRQKGGAGRVSDREQGRGEGGFER